MADDGKIYIVITNRTPQSVEQGTAGVEQKKNEDDKESVLGKYVFHQFFNLIQSQAQQAVSLSINNIGNFTGDYQSQRVAQGLMTISSRLAGIGLAAASGWKMSGSWIGAVIGAVVQTGTYAKDDIINSQLLKLQDRKMNFAIQQLQERSGLNTRIDGSRGTEN